ncbi:hypothetical protein N798_15220 [Knoellia flava TL1]|uniref:HTH luxR-type domain-containing protein n=2 Tax=Knoellia flava TaxID=913969 RepID=A0A8H9FS07_9MICO|nr:LuxR C-terminal-related transcriptional regulator [Knoellia flava]KGN29179.1 hypothetical protein N798_15220 [Knoellia flava TL1]GGB77513.1 hypothetical protein GCM10011314_16460 [Knoellia flava]
MSAGSTSSVRDHTARFADAWSAALRERGADRWSVLATTPERLEEQLALIEARTRRSLVNMQSRWWIDPHDRSASLDDRSRARGVTVTLFVPRRALELSPLLPSTHADVWVAPVLQDAMLVDDTLAILSGGLDDDGQRVFCSTTDAELVGLLREVVVALRQVAVRPDEVTGRSPLTPRQVQVALAVARGDKETTTARRLDTSLRTVEREVSAVIAHLGVRTRQEASLAILGERT